MKKYLIVLLENFILLVAIYTESKLRFCSALKAAGTNVRVDLKEICGRSITELIWLRIGIVFVCKPVRRKSEKCVGCHFLVGYLGCIFNSGSLL
jgi:hypothetical protein